MGTEIEKILQEILTSVKGLDARVAALEKSSAIPTIGSTATAAPTMRKQSIKEFLLEKSPSGGVQMTLAIAYYLETVDGLISFNKDDLERGYRAAKESVPKNINDKVGMCIASGYMMEAEAKKDSLKAWVITRTGEQAVEKGFSKEK